MNKNIYLGAAIVGALTTMVMAANHDLRWTILGVACVGLNIYNYLNSENKEGE